MGVRVTLGPDVKLDFGWVYIFYVCSGHRLLQETLGEEDVGCAILGALSDVTICEEGTFCG